MLLEDKIIVITGATAGIGEACARLFVREGGKIVVTGRRKDRLDALKASIPGAKIHALQVDVQNREAMTKALRELPEEFRKVDALINNAGLALGLQSLHTQTLDQIEQMIDTNIKGLLYATHALLPGMMERNRGHIVNLGSIAGTYPYPGGNVYGGTKAFLKQFTLNLRADLLGTKIRVTNIEPGMVDTEFSTVRFGDKNKADEVYANMQPLVAEDIADSILWAITRLAHVNINRIEIMPVQQAFSPFAVARKA